MSDDRPTPRRRGGIALSIQSKLLIMLLGVSLVSSIVVGAIGFVSGRDSLREAAFEQLTTIRELRADAIEREFANIQQGVALDSRNASAVEGTLAFVAAFDALQDAEIGADQSDELTQFYDDDFIPALEERTGDGYDAETFIPATPAGRYLQSVYVAGRSFEDFDAGLALTNAGDGSAWSAANEQYGSYFTGLIDELDYEDVLIIDHDGNIVYSAYKSVDLGVNVNEAPYTDSVLTSAVAEVLSSGSLNSIVTTDFQRYLPSLGVPTAWVVSPVGTTTAIGGVLAVQIPITQINAVMTGDEQWEAQGLGQTGEVYLAGSDMLMRSTSRLLVEHPDEYVETVTSHGTPVAVAERIIEVQGTVQLQPVDFLGVDLALRGESGTAITADYSNSDSLVAYAPLDIDGLNWVIVAHIDEAEAFAPVTDFTRTLVISTLGILLAVSLLSLLLAQVFTRPLKRLVDAVRRVAGGDLAVSVPMGARDEFGDLGLAFNDMAESLRIKQELIEEQQQENEKLLLTLMPATVAQRYKKGEETIAEDHDDVTVVYAELMGFDEQSAEFTSEQDLSRLNSLMRGFDEAAEKAGVEKVRTLRGGYLASSGLVIPRVDNIRRAVDFAVQMRGVVQRFNAQNGTSIDIRAGVNTGTVTSGLVGRTSLAYDLWGDAVNLAYRVRRATEQPGIYVSEAVRDRLQDSVEFDKVGSVEVNGQQQTVWRIR
ncbi:MAG: adenylate/guanylate cyclase domain-containing protein [Rhodoglobus sp.]